MNITKVDEVHELLETFSNIRDKLNQLDRILATDRDKHHKRNLGGFLVSSELYYSICEQIRKEYQEHYNELKSKLIQL